MDEQRISAVMAVDGELYQGVLALYEVTVGELNAARAEVERLQSELRGAEAGWAECARLLQDARLRVGEVREEVERLEKAVSVLTSERDQNIEHVRGIQEDRARLRAEVERLTAALEAIAGRGHVFDARGTYSEWVVETARRALAPSTEAPSEEK